LKKIKVLLAPPAAKEKSLKKDHAKDECFMPAIGIQTALRHIGVSPPGKNAQTAKAF
jgi:hypothetical protein